MKKTIYFKIFFAVMIIAFYFTTGLAVSKNDIEILTSQFIYEKAEFPSCHASTLVELDNGDILAAWFGGKEEKDNSVEIWMARNHRGKWSRPVAMTEYPNIPTWNPVLFRDNANKIWLFLKSDLIP